MMRIVMALLLMLCIYITARPQSAGWDVYLAQYDDGVGSTTLNMDLIKTAPVLALPFLVVTGVTVKDCPEDGLPVNLDDLYKISDDVNAAVSSLTRNEPAGTFTHQCDRLEYIYVADTLRIREQLEKLYKNKYASYKYYIGIEHDKAWEAYLTFLYPSEEILDFMSNTKVLEQLEEAGDKPEKPRLVEHWLYFKTSGDRAAFIKYAEAEKFKIEGTDLVSDVALTYQLHISRISSADIETISLLTSTLRKKAKEFNGMYDGWESVVVKD